MKIQNCIRNLTQRPLARLTRHLRFEQRPFRIRQIQLIPIRLALILGASDFSPSHAILQFQQTG